MLEVFKSYCVPEKRDGFTNEAAVAQLGRAADSEGHRPFEAEAVNQLVVGSSPTGGANNIVCVNLRLYSLRFRNISTRINDKLFLEKKRKNSYAKAI